MVSEIQLYHRRKMLVSMLLLILNKIHITEKISTLSNNFSKKVIFTGSLILTNGRLFGIKTGLWD